MARSSVCSMDARVEKRRCCWDVDEVDLRFLENMMFVVVVWLWCKIRCGCVGLFEILEEVLEGMKQRL